MEQVNYFLVIPFAILVILLIVFLIRRNWRDQKKVERNFIDLDVKTRNPKAD